MAMNIEETQEYLDSKARRGQVKLYIPEIFEFVGQSTKKDDKIEILRNNQSKAMLAILRLTYDPTIKFLLTPKEAKEIKYEDMDIADYPLAPTTLFREHKRLWNFTNVKGSNLRKSKLNILLSQMYSSLFIDEVNLIKAMVTKKLPYKGLTENLVREAFPGLLPEIKEEKEEKE